MILEATGRPGNLLKPIQYPRDVDLLVRFIFAILIGHQWLIKTWPLAQARTEVYLLTRYDLLRRRFVICPLGATFVSSVIFFLWLHWAYNMASFLIEKGMFPCSA